MASIINASINLNNIDKTKIIEGKKYIDSRGEFREIYKKDKLKEKEFKFTCYSKSKKTHRQRLIWHNNRKGNI